MTPVQAPAGHTPGPWRVSDAAATPTAQLRRVFVHRYKFSHENKRRKYRRMLKDGKAVLIEKRRDGWLYEVKK